jgi:DNA repair protein RadA/Sms
MKKKKRFVCKECGYTSVSWIGKCPECNSWNSFIEEIIENPVIKSKLSAEKELLNINTINLEKEVIIKTEKEEIDNFFGEGIVAGSVILITGEPGVGKSTFLLFLANLFKENTKIYYFSGEESQAQVKRRYDRLNTDNKNLYISNQIEIESIFDLCNKDKPDIIFIDSIQTCYSLKVDSSAGTISQIKHCTSHFIDYSKKNSIPIIIIGHITKSGDIAGPKIMEHMVDVVLYLDGDFQHQYRMLRSIKNRFGGIEEMILFEMKEQGLLLIDNPSGYFIHNDNNEEIFGRCKTIIMEGKKPLIIEVEALVVPSVYSNPRRFAEGVDIARVSRISAILDKHLNENLNNYDIYFNISGGIKTKDVGIDLAIALSIYSSKHKKVINNNIIILGELSLTGKLRGIFKLEQRIKEAKKFGAEKIFIPKSKTPISEKIIIEVNKISDSIKEIF